MSDVPENVIDLAAYRAERAARRSGVAPAIRYVLWYPGIGYFHHAPNVAALSAFGNPIGYHQPRS
jgi:hypothetical protein